MLRYSPKTPFASILTAPPLAPYSPPLRPRTRRVDRAGNRLPTHLSFHLRLAAFTLPLLPDVLRRRATRLLRQHDQKLTPSRCKRRRQPFSCNWYAVGAGQQFSPWSAAGTRRPAVSKRPP